MISYAQNGEDVRLRRAFPEPYRGFYVEVGAFDPSFLSITRHFYDRGWHGVSVEPSPRQHRLIAAARPRDIVLNVAVSDTEGEAVFHESEGEGLSTLELDEAERFRRDGFRGGSYKVRLRTLRSICEEFVREPIDFLTVDVEGHEGAVLRGADFQRFRPKVAVIEATRPRTTEPTHQKWERLLLDADYRFVAFDGVSRYYVAAEHPELFEKVAVPPSALDGYVPEGQARVQAELARLRRSPLVAPTIFVDTLLRRVAKGIAERLRSGR